MKTKLVLYAFAAIGILLGTSASAQSYAIRNARIVTVSGATIENGTVVVRDGLAYVNDMYNGLWIVRIDPKQDALVP